MEVTLNHYIILSSILFVIGSIWCAYKKRNLIVVLMSLELMLNSCNLAFISFAYFLGDLTGQIFMIMAITVAAAEVAVGLAFVVLIYNHNNSLDIDVLKLLKG